MTGFWAFLLDEGKKWAARTSIMLVAGSAVLLLTPISDRFAEIWHSPQRLDEVLEKLDKLASEVQRATGENRVIYETPGLSYVREPVFMGEQITLNMVIRRTQLGAACTLRNRTAIFTDETNIASAGATLRPALQMTLTDTPVRLLLDVPPQVQPGRVTVYLSLEFDCGGKTVFDTTRPVAFALVQP